MFARFVERMAAFTEKFGCGEWGNSEKDGPEYHLLPYHCLDVAEVAKSVCGKIIFLEIFCREYSILAKM